MLYFEQYDKMYKLERENCTNGDEVMKEVINEQYLRFAVLGKYISLEMY